MAGIFKAYDVRGLYPSQLHDELAYQIGLAYRAVLDEDDLRHGGGKIVVGRDMRPHSVPLQQRLIEGLRDSGLHVVDIGLATTPMNYFAVGHLGASGGIQVTASHNPAEYNGIKFSKREARPVSGDHGIPLIESKVTTGDLSKAAERGGYETTEIMEAYRAFLLGQLHRPEGAARLKVVVDAANGMGTIYQPILEQAHIELIPLYFELDGSFPNHEANPLKLANLRDLSAAVREYDADLGISFDGDADRSAFVDENGEPVGNDLTTALIAGEMLGEHSGSVVAYDLRSSRAVAEYIEEKGGQPVRERVGHSFIKATLRKHDGIFGGELAGHYYFRDTYTADNALLAAFHVFNLLWQTGRTFSELVRPLQRYAKSEETNFQVEDKQGKIELLAEKYSDGEIDYLDGITVQYDDWWFNVRPSNTEPYLRMVAEAKDQAQLDTRMAELIGLLGDPV
ncbi:MAG: phosphomannomutase/phosphoglucomutase [Thermoanaerobaculia bacterium]|nr:phosphomannomutase/phosphoglucomutase [Thermoanaerobaculia bacterium]